MPSGSAEGAALFRWLPHLAARVPWAPLGDWPTPLTSVEVGGRPLWIKHEGDASRRYGGNKVRTLEAWLGHARALGAGRIWAIGAYGSNHAIATVLHARAVGLDAGAIVFPQPASEWAIENAGALVATGCPIVRLRSVAEVPIAGLAIAERSRWSTRWPVHSSAAGNAGPIRGRELVMPPGGATPVGTLGAVSAAFELAEQLAAHLAPPPRRIVLPVGSTCTTAGLLAGLVLAHTMGAWRWPIPIVHAVRVTPWPVTSRAMIHQLALRTLARIAALGGPAVRLGRPRLVVDRHELGRGYGRPTDHGRAAMATLAVPGAPRLDGVYAAKAAAALLELHRRDTRPLLFWATKSSVLLPPPTPDALAAAPRGLTRWLAGT